MLNNTLGILIGFSTIILLFALLVTTLSQAIQTLAALRMRNLRKGIAWLLQETYGKTPEGAHRLAQAEQLRTLVHGLVTPDVTWLNQDELLSDLKDRGIELRDALLARFRLQFDVMTRYTTHNFTRLMQAISFFLALSLAILFQLDCLALLKRLSADPAYLARVDALTLSRVAADAPPDAATPPFAALRDESLRRFKDKHPQARPALEKFSSSATDSAPFATELQAALTAHQVPQVEALMAAYREIVDELRLEALRQQLKTARTLTDELAAIDLTIWPKGIGFYCDPARFLGVLMSAVFISLGAPFWYNTLKNLTNLRDMLKPPQADGKRL